MHDAALFDDFLVVGLQAADAAPPKPSLLYCFRTAQGVGGASVEAHNTAVVEFCFPDQEDASMLKLHSESFTFTLTQDDGSRTFGFSRRLAQPPGLLFANRQKDQMGLQQLVEDNRRRSSSAARAAASQELQHSDRTDTHGAS